MKRPLLQALPNDVSSDCMQLVSEANSGFCWPSTSSREMEEKDTGEKDRQEKAGRAAGEVIGTGLRKKLKPMSELQAPLKGAHLNCMLAVFSVSEKSSLCEAFSYLLLLVWQPKQLLIIGILQGKWEQVSSDESFSEKSISLRSEIRLDAQRATESL